MSSSWSQKNKPKSSNYFIVSGRAYPQVLAGKNPTNVISTNRHDREAFYRDPAVMLSDANMDTFNGTEGAPLCVEHNVNHVVGHVSHSWLGDGDKRGLKIMARISLDTPAGRKAAADVKAGKYKGFSVGYGTELLSNARTGKTTLSDKTFREISLVAEPFFDNCHIAWGIEASKKGTNNSAYLTNDESNTFYVAIEMSQEDSSSVPAQAESQQTQQQNAVPTEELLKETDKIKSQLQTEIKAREEAANKAAEIQKELEYYREKARQEASEYAKAQEPKFNAYVTELTATKGELSEAAKKGYRETFCNPRHKEAAQILEAEYKQTMELKASKKALEDQVAELKKANQTLEVTASKVAKSLNHSRTNFVEALSTQDAVEDESRRKHSTSVEASLKLNEIMVPEPSVAELPFLKAYGYSNEVNVNASRFDPYGGTRVLKQTIVAAAQHPHLRDEEGNMNLPMSARNIPGCDAFFAWMCNTPELANGDLTDMVSLVASKNTVERKDAAEWEARNMLRTAEKIGTAGI